MVLAIVQRTGADPKKLKLELADSLLLAINLNSPLPLKAMYSALCAGKSIVFARH